MSTVPFGIKISVSGNEAVTTTLRGMGNEFETAGNKATASFSKTRQGLDSISSQLNTLGNVAKAYFGATQLLGLSQTVLRTADEFSGLQARLRLVTTSQTEFNVANDQLFAIAQRNKAPLADTYALYTKLSPALRELGGTQAHTLAVSDLLTKSLLISGAGAAESSAAILQFAQALGSGVLRGDEFNSLMENAPRLMSALADGMHKPVGALRAMAEEGKLTAELVVNSLLSQTQKLSTEAAKMPMTVSAGWVVLGNTVSREIGRMDASVGVSSGLAKSLVNIANNIGTVEAAVVSLAKVGVAALIASLVTAKSAAISAAGMAGIGALRNAVAGLVLLYAEGGIAALASGVLGIGAAARVSTAPVLTLGGALKALVWPVALLYGVYEFAKFAEARFLAVRLGIVALAETFQKAAAIVSHPFDSSARSAAIAKIKTENAEIAAALIAESERAGGMPSATAIPKALVAKPQEESDKDKKSRLAAESKAQKEAERFAAAQEAARYSATSNLASERNGLDRALGEAQLADPNLEGDQRVIAQREIAQRAADAEYEVKQAAIERELERMTQDGTKTDAAAAAQYARKEVLEQTHQANKLAISRKYMTEREKFDAMSWDKQISFTAGAMEKLTQVGATKSRAMFEINKAASKARAVMNIASGVTEALANYPPPLSFGMAALVVAEGAAQLAAINGAQFAGGGSTAASVGASGGIPSMAASPVPQVSTTPTAAAPVAAAAQSTLTYHITIAGAAGNQDAPMISYNTMVNDILPLLKQAKDNGHLVDLNLVAA